MERRLPFPTKVLLNAVQVLHRDEKPITLGVFELEVLAVSPFRLDEPHSLEEGDAVIDVDD
jgi:hypothetical protein